METRGTRGMGGALVARFARYLSRPTAGPPQLVNVTGSTSSSPPQAHGGMCRRLVRVAMVGEALRLLQSAGPHPPPLLLIRCSSGLWVERTIRHRAVLVWPPVCSVRRGSQQASLLGTLSRLPSEPQSLTLLATTKPYKAARHFIYEAGRRTLQAKEAGKKGVLVHLSHIQGHPKRRTKTPKKK